MKLLLFVVTLCYFNSIAYTKDQQKSTQQYGQPSNQFQYKLMNDFKPIINRQQSTGDHFQFDTDDSSNEITMGPYYPAYQPLITGSTPVPITSLSSGSTQLKQISPSTMHHHQPMMNMNSPTPVIMQYMPTNTQSNGIQYLQLIPTRPLIVPISPYIASNAGEYADNSGFSPILSPSPPNQKQPPFQSSSGSAPASLQSMINQLSGIPLIPPAPSSSSVPGSVQAHHNHALNYAPRSFVNTNFTPSASTMKVTPSLSSQNYRYIRPDTGIELLSGPTDFSLNTNEYVPNAGFANVAEHQENN